MKGLTIEVKTTIRSGRKIIGSVSESTEIKTKSIETLPWYVLLLATRLTEGAFSALED